jgi:hypothetical protein
MCQTYPRPARAWRVATLLLLSLALVGPPPAVVAAPLAADESAGSESSGSRPELALSSKQTDHAELAAGYGRLPLSFEGNRGQADPSVDFLAHGSGYTLLLSGGELLLSVRQPRTASADPDTVDEQPPSVLRLQLHGANPVLQAEGEALLPGTVNYLLGNDPSRWHTGIPTYARVRYPEVYPGVDLVYYGNQGQLEYDFVVAPGADPRLIRLAFDGAEQVRLEDTGGLVVQVAGAQLHQAAPLLYQDGPQDRQVVAGGYIVDELGEVGFAVGAYDTTRPLIIDPCWSTPPTSAAAASAATWA